MVLLDVGYNTLSASAGVVNTDARQGLHLPAIMNLSKDQFFSLNLLSMHFHVSNIFCKTQDLNHVLFLYQKVGRILIHTGVFLEKIPILNKKLHNLRKDFTCFSFPLTSSFLCFQIFLASFPVCPSFALSGCLSFLSFFPFVFPFQFSFPFFFCFSFFFETLAFQRFLRSGTA